MDFILKIILALAVVSLAISNYIKFSLYFPINLPTGLELVGGLGAILFFVMSLYGIVKFHKRIFNVKRKESKRETNRVHFLIGLTLVILLISGFAVNVLTMIFAPISGSKIPLSTQFIEIPSLCIALFFMIAGFFAFANE